MKNSLLKILLFLYIISLTLLTASEKDIMELNGIKLLTKKDDVTKELGSPIDVVKQDNSEYLIFKDKTENDFIVQIGNYGYLDQVTAVQYSGSNNSSIKLKEIGLQTSRYQLVQKIGQPDIYRDSDENSKFYYYGNSSYRINSQDIVDSLRIDLPHMIAANKLYSIAMENELSEYEACLYVAQYYKDIQAYEVAKTYFEKAFKYKKEWQIEHNYANTLKEMGDYKKALSIYKSIQAKVKYNELIEYNIGLAYYQLGELVNAEKQFEQLIEYKETKKEILFSSLRMLGNINDDQGEKDKAISYYEKALTIDSQSAQLLYDMGVYYKGEHDLQKAKEYFQKTLTIDPNHFSAKQELESI